MRSNIDKNKEISIERQQEVEQNFETLVNRRRSRYYNTTEQINRTDFFEDYYLLYNRLKAQVGVIEKALELACERVKYFEEMQDKEMGHFEFFGYDSNYDLQSIIEQYKNQAEEVMKSE